MTNDIDLTNKIVVVGLDAAGLSTLKDTPLGLMTDMQISCTSNGYHCNQDRFAKR